VYIKIKKIYIKDENFNPEGGPVFFYAGNEGDIENFWNNTGFIFDLAPIFQALIVFPEHVKILFLIDEFQISQI
jgi:hypothetical protein